MATKGTIMTGEPGTEKKEKRDATQGHIKWVVNKAGKKVGYCEVMLGYDAAGKRIRRSVHGETEREIAKQVRALLNKRDDHTLTSREAERETFGGYLDRWLLNIKRGLAPRSWRRHEQNANLHIKPVLGR